MNRIKCAICSGEWWTAALIRALKTVCQTAIALIGTAVLIENVNWLAVLSGAGLAGILSLLTSLAGLPEVGKEEQSVTNTERIDENEL